jgi:hypothetical protein
MLPFRFDKKHASALVEAQGEIFLTHGRILRVPRCNAILAGALLAHLGMMVRRTIGTLFLLAQLGLVGYARFVPTRWLCWAPNDYAVQYELQVRMSGRDLSPVEIQKRYQLPHKGWYENPAENIMDIVRQYERTEGRNESARVLLVYSVDGGQAREWQWPGR